MQYIRKVDHATSVKEINIVKETNSKENGIADFKYRPVFSVFDFGTITPPVYLDNSTINLMQAFNFELLKDQGIDSHYLGLIDEIGNIISAKEAIKNKVYTNTCRVKFVNREKPEFIDGKWDYSLFKNIDVNNYVLPIEFISRNSLPESSSVWKRIDNGEISIEDLGLSSNFKKGDKIDESLKPILDYSTKFEPDDRYISKDEAFDILGISKDDFNYINSTTAKLSQIMTNYAKDRGFIREDGKIEYLTLNENGEQKILIADAVCTWHEDRLISENGLGISKQRVRDKVKNLNPKWYEEIQNSKQRAKKEGVDDFRKLMNKEIKYTSPEPNFFIKLNTLFQAATNKWIDNKYYEIYKNKNESIDDNLNRASEEFLKVK